MMPATNAQRQALFTERLQKFGRQSALSRDISHTRILAAIGLKLDYRNAPKAALKPSRSDRQNRPNPIIPCCAGHRNCSATSDAAYAVEDRKAARHHIR
jgi:hypothetical protein